MVMSLRLMTAGTGYRYPLSSVAAGDGDRDLSSSLTRYYSENGTPPGFWAGSGTTALHLRDRQRVTEQHLELLLGHGLHPLTAEPLGRAYPNYPSRAERIASRIATLDVTLDDATRRAEMARIEAEEQDRSTRHAVAGFDLTFSVPKSVSVLWGLADAGTQQIIADAHHEAVGAVLDLFERQVACTRTGVTKPANPHDGGGAVIQSDVVGVAAACFDHYDSRAGDPQLHTHCVVSNKVLTKADGQWRSLDSRPVHASANAMSETYNAILADILTRDLGLGWGSRERGQNRNPAFGIAAVPQTLLDSFSSRSSDIEAATDALIADYQARHGRRPSREAIIALRQQATLETRPAKHLRSLADLTAEWRSRATSMLGQDANAWVQNVLRASSPSGHTARSTAALSGAQPKHLDSTSALRRQRPDLPPLLRADDIPTELIADVAADVVAVVSAKRATWKHWNLYSEATRQTMGWRFATPADRETITSAITESAKAASMALTPDELAAPARLRRPDGTSRLRPANAAVYTSQAIWDAEERLLGLAADPNGPTVDPERIPLTTHNGTPLGPDQYDALQRIAASGLVIDVLIGPAGAGKTTTMNALKVAWEQQHGAGSVVGLAPSATAAAVLGQDLGISTENTSKWLADRQRTGQTFTAGQLVIIDEASLSGTIILDRITTLASQAGAKVLLVGDTHQLQAVEAGGAFTLIVGSRDDAPQLSDIHRFRNPWERAASLELRLGNLLVIDTYAEHGRIREGDTDTMLQAAYQAWLTDTANGLTSVLIADDRNTVADLNRQARHDRIAAGQVDPTRHIDLAEGTRASVGDTVITRLNDRRLIAGRTGWVRNGDRWTITALYDDGSVTVRRAGHQRGASVVLPAAYVQSSLDLGYAVSAYRAQGLTVDASHAVITARTPRENMYVALTRGRDANMAYITTDTPEGELDRLHDDQPTTARDVLTHVLATSGAEPSAHQAQADEHERWLSLPQLVAEYQQIVSEARRDYNSLPDADKAALMRQRMASGVTAHPRLIAGLIPEPTIPMAQEMRHALDTRRDVIEQRVAHLAKQALAQQPAWLAELGPQPADQAGLARWNQALRAVVTFRDLHGISGNQMLGGTAGTRAQTDHRTLVRRAVKAITHPEQNQTPQLAAPTPAVPRPPATAL